MVHELTHAVSLIAVGAALASVASCVETEEGVDELRVTGVATVDGAGVLGCGAGVNSMIASNVGVVFRTNGTAFLDRSQGSVFAFLCVRNEGMSSVRLYEYDLSDGATPHGLSEVVVPPGGQAIVEVEILSSPGGTVMAGELGQGEAVEEVVGVAIRGRTALGIEVETPEFFMPVRLYRVDEFCVCDADPARGEVACPEDDAACL